MDFLFKLVSLIMLLIFISCVIIVVLTETGVKAEGVNNPSVLQQLK